MDTDFKLESITTVIADHEGTSSIASSSDTPPGQKKPTVTNFVMFLDKRFHVL